MLKTVKTNVSHIDSEPSIHNAVLLCITGSLAVSSYLIPLRQFPQYLTSSRAQKRSTWRLMNQWASRRPSFWHLFQDSPVVFTSTTRTSGSSKDRYYLHMDLNDARNLHIVVGYPLLLVITGLTGTAACNMITVIQYAGMLGSGNKSSTSKLVLNITLQHFSSTHTVACP